MHIHDLHRPLSDSLRMFAEQGLVIIDGIESLQGKASFVPDFPTLVLKRSDMNQNPV